MTLTLNVLNHLHADDEHAAAALVRQSGDGAALIELLELLWSAGVARAPALVGPVLERLSQLSPVTPGACR